MYPAAALMEVVEAHQIQLEAVTDAIGMKTFGLMAAIGKIELDNFRERSTMGKRGSAKQGRMPAGAPPTGIVPETTASRRYASRRPRSFGASSTCTFTRVWPGRQSANG